MSDPHKAVDYIIKNAGKFAQAKANRVYLEEFRKSKKALLMGDNPALKRQTQGNSTLMLTKSTQSY